MTKDEYRVIAVKQALKIWPWLTDKQVVKLVDEHIVRDDTEQSLKLWRDGLNEGLRHELTDAELRGLARENPDRVRKAPTLEQFITLKEKQGNPLSPERRLEYRDLTPDDLLDLIPPNVELPETKQTPAPKHAANSIEALDAEITARTGRDWRTMHASERIEYHKHFRAERASESPTDMVTRQQHEAVLAKAGGELGKLSPEQRINLYRAQEAAKKSNGA